MVGRPANEAMCYQLWCGRMCYASLSGRAAYLRCWLASKLATFVQPTLWNDSVFRNAFLSVCTFVMLPQARWLLKKSKGFFKKQMASFKDIKVKSSCIYSVHSKKRFFQGFVESFEACYVIGHLFFVEVGWSSGSGFCCVWIRTATWLYFVRVTQYSWWGLGLIEMCPAQWVTLRYI